VCSLWAQKGEVTAADTRFADHENAKMASLDGFSLQDRPSRAPAHPPSVSPTTLEPAAPRLLVHRAIEVWCGVFQDHEAFAL
jgi:hypothetical protein